MEAWVNDYIGIPYLFSGETRAGADCWGLVRMVLREQFGKDLPAVEHIEADPKYLSDCVDIVRPIVEKVETPKLGDLVLLNLFGYPSHIGVYVDEGYMLHSLHAHDSAIEKVNSLRWIKRLEGFYRVR